MNNRFVVDKFTAQEWTTYGKLFTGNNIYQTWSYGEAHSQGWLYSVSRAVLFQGDRPMVMAQFRIAKIPCIGIGIATADWGPLWHYDDNRSSAEDYLSEFLSEVRNEYGVKRGLQVRFDPRSTFIKDQDARLSQIFEQQRFFANPNVRPYRTIILDLEQDLDVLRKNLHGDWRKHLVRAERPGLLVEFGSSVELFDRFRKIYDEMWGKKTFETGVNYNARRRMQNIAPEDELVMIWLFRHGEQDIGAGGFSALGNTMLSFLAATSPNAPKHANSGYLMHWLGVCKAKELGLRWHDLGGVTDIPGNEIDKFKKRMNGTYVMFPGRFELRRGMILGTLIDGGIKISRKLRRIL